MGAALPARAAPDRLEMAAVRVRVPFRRPFATAAGTYHARETWIVRLRDGSGSVGHGEAGLAPGADGAALERLARSVRDATAHAWHDGDLRPWLAPSPMDGADDPIGLAVRAAIQGAALDLGLVGAGAAEAATVEVNATIAGEDHAASVADARTAAAAGFRCLKLKVGSERTTAELVARIGAVREAVGPALTLRLDANGAWDAATALERGTGVAAFGLEYLEQPIPSGVPAELAELRHASPVAIAADEAVTSLGAARALLAADAVDVLVIKPARVGGPAAALAIAEAALAAGVGVTISTLLETGVGLAAAARVAAALPDRGHAHGLATGELLADDLLATPLRVVDGRLGVPRPGLALDAAAIERWAVERAGDPW
ncbi:MAG: o-succinylbenzoate synthase [Candidatus Limnocylindria bacterium]